jgi:hypothetical protein
MYQYQLTVPAALSMALRLRFSFRSTPTRFRQLKAARRKLQPGDGLLQRNDVGFAFDFKLSCGMELSHSGDLRRLLYSQAGLGSELVTRRKSYAQDASLGV